MARTKAAEAATDEETTDVKPRRRRITKRKAVEQHARSYFEAMGRRDAAAMAEHWREDGVDDVVPMGVLRGRAQIRDFMSSLFAALPDATVTVTRVVAGERTCAVEWRLEGTHSGAPFMEIEPTGRRVDLRLCDLFEIEDGEIVSNAGYYDSATFARQIGMLPQDGSGADRAMRGAFNTVTRFRRAVAERRGA